MASALAQANSEVRPIAQNADLTDLDRQISMAEVKAALDGAKLNSRGGDGEWTYEMFKRGGEPMQKMLTDLIEIFFATEQVPEALRLGDIVIAFKDGDRRQPLDYRPLTLLHVVGKIYCTILANRLSETSERENILCDEQGGFRKGRSQSDQLFTLIETIRLQRHHKRGLHAMFVDIRKAYDRVHRTGLWIRLWECGIKSKMWRIINNLYEDVRSRIRINDSDTDWFNLAEGLRQGCVLSPLLYAIFINSLADTLKEAAANGSILGIKLSVSDQLLLLLYADDIVLLAETRDDLQRMADVLARHAREWRYEVNLKKTKYMVFSTGVDGPVTSTESKSLKAQPITYGAEKHKIEQVKSYKYLGVLLTESLDWKQHKEHVYAYTRDAKDSARRAGMLSMHPKVASILWTSLIRSCTEYAADVWSDPGDQWKEIEMIQVNTARAILRINNTCKPLFATGELGWMQLATRRHLARLRYLWRLTKMPDSRWPKRLLNMTKEVANHNPESWIEKTHKLIDSLGLSSEASRIQEMGEEEWNQIARKALMLRDEKRWAESVQSDRRLNTYASLYTSIDTNQLQSVAIPADIGMGQRQALAQIPPVLRHGTVANESRTTKRIWQIEDYLHSDDPYYRHQMCRLRHGAHQLRVSTGRLERSEEDEKKTLEREKRICELCNSGKVEDENHFVYECNIYEDLRVNLMLRLEDAGCTKMRLDEAHNGLLSVMMGGWAVKLTAKQRSATLNVCRQFLKKALSRRKKELKSIHKQVRVRNRSRVENSISVQAVAGGEESKEPQVVACEPLIHHPDASAEVESMNVQLNCVNESSAGIDIA